MSRWLVKGLAQYSRVVSSNRSRSTPSTSFFTSLFTIFRTIWRYVAWDTASLNYRIHKYDHPDEYLASNSAIQTHRNSPRWQAGLRIWGFSRWGLVREHEAEAPAYLHRNLNPALRVSSRGPLETLVSVSTLSADSHHRVSLTEQIRFLASVRNRGMRSFDTGLSNAALVIRVYFPGALIYSAGFNVNQNFKTFFFLKNSMFQFFSWHSHEHGLPAFAILFSFVHILRPPNPTLSFFTGESAGI
jgi:hypothetical protein